MRRDPTEFRKRFAAWKDGKQPYENGLPKYEDGKPKRVNWSYWDNKKSTDHVIPFEEEKAIKLTNAGLATGAVLSTNLLDSIADNADRAGLRLQTALGLATKESTLGNPTDDRSAWKISSGIRLQFNGNYPGTQQHINNGRDVPELRLVNYHKGDIDPTVFSFGDKHGGLSILLTAFEFFKKHPDKYNPGQKNYQKLVNKRGEEVMLSPEILKWATERVVKKLAPRFTLQNPLLNESKFNVKKFRDGKLPGYAIGTPDNEEVSDATYVLRPMIVRPIKRNFIAEAQRKHAAEAVGPDTRSSYQRKQSLAAKLYANQQYQKAKDDVKRAEGLELMMKTVSPSTYVEAATGLDLGTVGRFVTDAAVFGLPSILKHGISKALSTPIFGKWVYNIPENANMAYRIMGPLERDWLMLGNELSTRATNIATKAEEVAARTKGGINLYKAGAEHGGRKQFAKGQPWHANTTTHGERQVLAIPGEDLPWISGKHYHGPQGNGWRVGDVSFEEAPFGTHIDLMTNEAGFSGVNPSQLPGSVIYSPSKLFGKNLGYKILNLDRSKLASRVPGLKIHSLEHPLDSWIHTPEKQSYIRFPYSASWDDFLTDPKLGKYFTEGGEAEVYESFNNPGYLTKVKLKIPEEGTTLEDLEYAVNRDLKINELPGTEPIVYKGFSTPEIIRRSLNQDTRFVSDEFVPIWELRKLTPTDKVNFEAFNVDPEQIVNDFASDFGYRYNPDGSWQFGKIKLSDLGIKNFAYDSFGNLKFIDPMIQGFKDGKSPIHIKPSHRGKLTALKKRTGKSESELYNDGNPAHKKMVVFARNARKWKH